MRVREVAEAAGASEPSVYHYFGSRAGLVEAAQVVRYGNALTVGLEHFAAAAEQCTTGDDFRRAIESSLLWSFGSDRAGHRSERLSVLGSALQRPALLEQIVLTQREITEVLASVLRSAQQRGWTRPDLEPTAAATWVIGGIMGRNLVEMDPDHFDGEEWDRVAVSATLYAIVGPDRTV